MNGIEHIKGTFSKTRAEGRGALMPYFPLGYPNVELSVEIITAIAKAGADLIELGIPFSDPLADGPTIQYSTQVALEQGVTLAHCLEMTATLRKHGVEQPLLLMGYYNPILSFGLEHYVARAAAAGADGFIIPDLPVEEAGELENLCKESGLALVYLAAPTTPPERLSMIARHTSGFLYLVSVTGVTGARSQLSDHLEDLLHKVRNSCQAPIAVGFGISTPDQTRQVGQLADGVIVGSALVQKVRQAALPAEEAAEFVRSLRQALVRYTV